MSDTTPPPAAPTPPPAPEPPIIAACPPPPPSAGRQFLAFVLSFTLAMFLADACISLADHSLTLLAGVGVPASLRNLVCLLSLLLGGLIYCLMAFAPMIPKRLFLPITLFNPITALLALPVLIYAYRRLHEVAWLLSAGQLLLGLGVLYRLRRLDLRWPWVLESQLKNRPFSWFNFFVFVLVNLFVALPATLIFLAVCATLAVDHFTAGFLELRPVGLTVQVRTYTREDGKRIQLFPMSHVGDPAFYRQLSQAFTSNSLILMEGVSDEGHLLTNKITYHRMATSLGLAEQQREFKPNRGEVVRADLDVAQFSTNTIGFLNLAMLLHSRGLSRETLTTLLQYAPTPHAEEQLLDDLVRKRNQHLVAEIQKRLPESSNLIVPWGVAHMPGISAEIQKAGFHLVETQDFVAIRFRAH